jgi:hypothetical protein
MDEMSSCLPAIDEAELERVVGGEATRAEKWAMNTVDRAISYFDPTWTKSDCAGRYGYIGWGYGWSTGTASTLLLAGGGNKATKVVGGVLGGVTGLYGARLQREYVENCKAKQAAAGG